MLNIIQISPRGFGANTYVITADNKNAVVIDPAQPRVQTELIRLNLTARFVLLTHCHFDHVGGTSALQQAGAKVLCLDKEKPLIGTDADLFARFHAHREWFTIDKTLTDGEKIELCSIPITVLSTAGHTAGSACYLIEDAGEKHLFTGDTLFNGSIGRTDFPTGDLGALRQSLKRLFALEDMPVYAGHGEKTTLSFERKNNPFFIDI